MHDVPQSMIEKAGTPPHTKLPDLIPQIFRGGVTGKLRLSWSNTKLFT